MRLLEPNQVVISGNFKLKEENGNDVVFTCSYDAVTPNINKVEFYLNDVKVENSGVSLCLNCFLIDGFV